MEAFALSVRLLALLANRLRATIIWFVAIANFVRNRTSQFICAKLVLPAWLIQLVNASCRAVREGQFSGVGVETRLFSIEVTTSPPSAKSSEGLTSPNPRSLPVSTARLNILV